MASPQPFELVVQWLYIGTIDKVPDKSPKGGHPPYNMFTYIRLWCLCDKERFDIPALQALAMERMRDYHRIYSVSFDAPKVEYIYNHTTRFSPLRELVANDAAYEFMRRSPGSRLCDGRFGDSGFEYMTEDVEFAVDVLYAIRRALGSMDLPPAFESDVEVLEDPDVFGEKGDLVKSELDLKTAMCNYGLGGNAHGLLTPDPTPQRKATPDARSPSDDAPHTPSEGAKGNADRQSLTLARACSC